MTLRLLVPGQMIIDITPAWWRGGPYTMEDAGAILSVLEHADFSTAPTSIEADIVDVVIGVHGVRLVLAMSMDHRVAKIDMDRVEIVQRLDALAFTKQAWMEQIRRKAEFAAEKQARTSRATAQA